MPNRQHYWSRHLDRIAAEEIATAAYARREGLSAPALYYWRKRIKTKATAGDSAGVAPGRRLVPVRVTDEPAHKPCTLTLAPGIELALPEWPSPQWLARVVAAQAATTR